MEPDRRDEHHDMRFPDAGPLRRIQATTAALIAIVAVVTLLSGSRPAEVRWGTVIGIGALVVVVAIVLRRRNLRADKEASGEDGPGA